MQERHSSLQTGPEAGSSRQTDRSHHQYPFKRVTLLPLPRALASTKAAAGITQPSNCMQQAPIRSGMGEGSSLATRAPQRTSSGMRCRRRGCLSKALMPSRLTQLGRRSRSEQQHRAARLLPAHAPSIHQGSTPTVSREQVGGTPQGCRATDQRPGRRTPPPLCQHLCSSGRARWAGAPGSLPGRPPPGHQHSRRRRQPPHLLRHPRRSRQTRCVRFFLCPSSAGLKTISRP